MGRLILGIGICVGWVGLYLGLVYMSGFAIW